MLFLLFDLGKERYALEAAGIVEVLPLVDVKQIPCAPPGVAGVFNYHGAAVPVIDLSHLALGQPARRRLSTRIILVNYSRDGGTTHVLGLIAEGVTELLRRERADFTASGIGNESAPYLGPIAHDARGLIQWIDVNGLLSEAVRAVLFGQPTVC
jgi:chemotaxis-related protein WspB